MRLGGIEIKDILRGSILETVQMPELGLLETRKLVGFLPIYL